MIAVTPVTREQFRAGFRKAQRSRNRQATYSGICPLCGKPTSYASGVAVFTNREGDRLYTDAEAQSLSDEGLAVVFVGPACLKAIGTEYQMRHQRNVYGRHSL